MHGRRLILAGSIAVLTLAASGPLRAADGAKLYEGHCVACHQPDGNGAEGLAPPEALFLACEASGTPLLTTPKPCSAVIDLLRIYLSRRLADTTSLHGVFMDVLGMGVLVTGDSGVGKSELALELISRGHGLVASTI